MASTYSSRLKLELMETGANANTWGNNTNTNLQTVDAFTAGYISKSVAGSANVTLTTNNADPDAESSNKVIELTGSVSADIYVFIPAVENNYIIYNNTTGSNTVTIAATGHAANGIAVTQGAYAHLYCDGASNYNVVDALSSIGTTTIDAATITNNLSVGGIANVTGNVNVTGNLSVTENATFSANVSLSDSDYLRLGTDQDLTVVHDGTNSIINNGTGSLLIQDNASTIANVTSTGIDITGQVLADKAYIAESTLTDGATIDWDMSTEAVAKVTLGGNRTINAPTNGSTGQFASLLVIQDGTGSRTVTWNAVYEFKDDTAPTLTTAASKGDLFNFRYNGSKWLEVGRNLNLTLS